MQSFDRIRPKCLCVSLSTSLTLFMKRGGCAKGTRFLEMIIEVVLFGLKSTSQVFAQVEIEDKSRLRRTAASSGVLTIMYKFVSSANSLIEQPIFLTISFIYIKNNKGPKIEPCGTPALTGAQSDEAPFNTTRCWSER